MTATTQGHQRAAANGEWPRFRRCEPSSPKDPEYVAGHLWANYVLPSSPLPAETLRDHFRDIWNDAYQQAWDDCRAGRDINAAVNPYLGEKP